jgi:hypothetical protein
MMKQVAAEGMITGTTGATVVAAWFLMYDPKAHCCSKQQGVSASFAPGEFSLPAGNES